MPGQIIGGENSIEDLDNLLLERLWYNTLQVWLFVLHDECICALKIWLLNYCCWGGTRVRIGKKRPKSQLSLYRHMCPWVAKFWQGEERWMVLNANLLKGLTRWCSELTLLLAGILPIKFHLLIIGKAISSMFDGMGSTCIMYTEREGKCQSENYMCVLLSWSRIHPRILWWFRCNLRMWVSDQDSSWEILNKAQIASVCLQCCLKSPSSRGKFNICLQSAEDFYRSPYRRK